MARRRKRHVNTAEARERAVETQRREAPVVGKEENATEWARREEAFLRQKVRLKNGVEMELGDAENLYLSLKALMEEEPRRFETLLALVRPSNATCLPEQVSAAAIQDLKKSFVLGPGDMPSERTSAVLAAAYIEKDGGGLLRDPVIYPSRQFAEEREALDKEGKIWAARSPRVWRTLFDDEDDGSKDQKPSLG